MKNKEKMHCGDLPADEFRPYGYQVVEIDTSGDARLSHTQLNGKFTLRLPVGSIRVEERHLK